MKTPLESAVQGAVTLPFFPLTAKRSPAQGEDQFCSLEPTRPLRALSLSDQSWLGAAPIRLLVRTGWEKLSQGLDALPTPLTATTRRQSKVFESFGDSIQAAIERRSYWSTVIACIAGSQATMTPPDTKRASLQVTATYTSDLAAIDFA